MGVLKYISPPNQLLTFRGGNGAECVLLHYWSAQGHQVEYMGWVHQVEYKVALFGVSKAGDLHGKLVSEIPVIDGILFELLTLVWNVSSAGRSGGFGHYIYAAESRRAVLQRGPLLKLKMVVNCWVLVWCRNGHAWNIQHRDTGQGFIKCSCLLIWFF